MWTLTSKKTPETTDTFWCVNEMGVTKKAWCGKSLTDTPRWQLDEGGGIFHPIAYYDTETCPHLPKSIQNLINKK
jgi:hypothetical protein